MQHLTDTWQHATCKFALEEAHIDPLSLLEYDSYCLIPSSGGTRERGTVEGSEGLARRGGIGLQAELRQFTDKLEKELQGTRPRPQSNAKRPSCATHTIFHAAYRQAQGDKPSKSQGGALPSRSERLSPAPPHAACSARSSG
jgi:hypothetical protein